VTNQTPTSSGPQAVPGLMSQAEKHFQAGRLGDAEVLLRNALKIQPNNADALYALGLVAYRAGKPDAAILLIAEAIDLNPSAVRFHTNICAMYEMTGQLQKAIEHGRIAVTLKPQSSEAHNNLGVAYLSSGEPSIAVEHFTKAIEADKRNADALSNRSKAQIRLRRPADAARDARAASELVPNNASALNGLAAALVALNDHAGAEAAVRRALAIQPGNLEAMLNLAIALKGQKKLEDALAIANQTAQMFPGRVEPLSLAAEIYLDRRADEAAARLIEQALALDPDDAGTLLVAGRLHTEGLRPEKALEFFRRAVASQPASSEAHLMLGIALRQSGQFDAAIKSIEHAMALNPENVAAYLEISEAKQFVSESDPHFVSMKRLSESAAASSRDQVAPLYFALGKAFDDLNQPDQAFASFEKACALMRRSITFSEPVALELFDRIQRDFTPAVVERLSGSGDPSQLPLFVMGMPRSGTTLVEQILSSHPMVMGGGELVDVRDALGDLRSRVEGNPPYPEMLQSLSVKDVQLFGNLVARRLGRRADGRQHITDKMTSNFFFVGLLHLALPRAKIIHVRRNAVDTCLSCYTKLFRSGVEYSYDLGELGRYYAAYDRLMAHWKRVLPPGAFLEVRYEDVVGDLEGQAKRILSHCDLPWDESVLAFHQNERSVRTASGLQVRQPLYASSVARWRRYEAHLSPLLKELGDLANQ
jgi:tetratricopeptide (TPR) repeat protein